MLQLARECFLEICSYLDSCTLIEMSLVCKTYREHLQDENIWKAKCRKELGITELIWPYKNWRYAYFNCCYGALFVPKYENGKMALSNCLETTNVSGKEIPNVWTAVTLTSSYIYTLDTTGGLWVRERSNGYNNSEPGKLPVEIGEYKFLQITSCLLYCLVLSQSGTLYKIYDGANMQKLLPFPEKVYQMVAHYSYVAVLSIEGDVCFISDCHPRDIKWNRMHIRFGVSLPDERIVQLAPVGSDIVALTDSNRVWMLRCRDYHRFSDDPRSNMFELVHFSGPTHRNITGSYDRFAVFTRDGQVLLGDHKADAYTIPIRPSFLQDVPIRAISFGSHLFGALNYKGEVLTWSINTPVNQELPEEQQSNNFWLTDVSWDNFRERSRRFRERWQRWLQNDSYTLEEGAENRNSVTENSVEEKNTTEISPYEEVFTKWEDISDESPMISQKNFVFVKSFSKDIHPLTIQIYGESYLALGTDC
ncbi:hypothetical protein BY458DRAFT_522954 [Sporodiniella umbellata]|nr:hypothetical protein BY458DRAFT_522954 [Sporodiniella umbellata]